MPQCRSNLFYHIPYPSASRVYQVAGVRLVGYEPTLKLPLVAEVIGGPGY